MRLIAKLLCVSTLLATMPACLAQSAFDHAEEALLKKDYPTAAGEFQQLVNIQPTNVALILKLAEALAGKGDLDNAIKRAREATHVKSDSVDAHLHLGRYLDQNRDEQAAAIQYERCLELKSSADERRMAYKPLIRLLDKLGAGQRKKLISVARQFVREFPDDPISHYDLAWTITQVESEKVDEAIKEYRKSLSLNKDMASARYNLALLLNKQGQSDEAIRELESFASTARKDDPDLSQAMDLLKKLKGEVH